MKNLITFLFYCLSVTALIAQTSGDTRLEVLQSGTDETVLQLSLSGVDELVVQTPNGQAIIPQFKGGTPLLKAGSPDIQKFAAGIRIPATGAMAVEVLSADYEDFTNVEIAPSKGDLKRNIDPATVPYSYGGDYQRDKFFPGNPAELQQPFVMRNARGQALWLFPVQYNPVTKVMRVYHSLTVRIYNTGAAGVNEMTSRGRSASRSFDQIFDKLFVNNPAFAGVRSNNLEPEKMLVIAKDEFIPDIEPLVEWKRQMGIHTTVVPVSEIGANDAASVYNYVKNYYNDHNITYLLLVGDENDIDPQMRPSGGTNYSCDNCFGYMDDTDHLPEVFVGRFNAANADQLKIMVARNLDYEKTPLVDTLNNWTATAMASCSNEGAGIGDDGQADWQQGNGLKTDHLADGFEKIWEFYDGNHAADSPTPGDISADISGNPVNTQLVQLMNNRGVSLYNYCGHGWEQGLVSGNFNTDAVAQLRNTHRYPIVVAVACCAGNFTNNGGGDCLGEALQRAGDAAANEPWGSIAAFMSSDFQSWAPPMEGQDGMNAYLIDADGVSLSPKIGGMGSYGNALMILAYGNGGEVMADFWNPFFEPTTVPRTRAAQTLTATTPGNLFVGATSLSIDCAVEGAIVSLYWQGQTLAVGTVVNGTATLEFPSLNNVGDLTITCTQFNYTPFQVAVPVTPASGPFVINQLLAFDDAAGNNNQQADYGETVNINLQLANVGVQTATATSATLTTTDDNVTITDGIELFGDLSTDAQMLVNSAFSFQVNNDVIDGHIVTFTLHITFSDTMGYELPVNVELMAPKLEITTLSIDDTQGGNGNHRLDGGETATIRIHNLNAGQSASTNALGALVSDSPWLTVSSTVDLGTLAATTGAADALFTVSVDAAAPQVVPALFHYSVQAGNYSAEKDFGPYLLNAIVEDFETHNFTSFDWQMSGNKPWTISTYQPYAGQYCSRSGTIADNEKSKMSVILDVTQTGTISFTVRMSSEADYDFLRFFIDDVELDAWSGILPWQEVSFPVDPGIHTFTWSYEKDEYGLGGNDRAYVDEILLPPHQVFVAAHDIDAAAVSASVSPNPSSGTAILRVELPSEQSLEIDLLDNLGRKVQTLQPLGKQTAGLLSLPIRMDSEKPGMYYVRLRSESGVMVLKFVKN